MKINCVNDNRPIEIVAIMPDKGGYTLFYYKNEYYNSFRISNSYTYSVYYIYVFCS